MDKPAILEAPHLMLQASDKICKTCNLSLPLSNFDNDKKSRDKLRYSCKSCEKLITKSWKKSNPDKVKLLNRKYKLKGTYGLTLEQYTQLLDEQYGLCAICKEPPSGANFLHVDHCHKTNKIRGLLCTRCNPGIGYFEDNIAKLEAAIKYLKSHKNE